MSGRPRMILAIVGIVIVWVLFFFLFVRSRQGELSGIRADIQAEENRAQQLTTELNRLKDLQARAPELQAELAKIRELVPQEHEVPHFIFLVQDAADAAGVSFVTITPELPRTPPEAAPLAQVRMAIGASGSYFSVQDFVRRLQELDRATRIDTINLSGAGETAPVTLALEMNARIFFELPQVVAPEGAPEGVPPPTEPVGEETPAG